MQTEEEIAQLKGRICTVISCLPFPVSKTVPQCYPGYYNIPEVKNVFQEVELLHVGSSTSKFYIGGERNETGNRDDEGWITKTVLSEEIAAAICRDEVMSCINIQPGFAEPAIFWLDSLVNKVEVILKHKDKLEEVRQRQKNWFIELVNEADKDFARLRSPGAVSGLQKKAARFLNLKKDWDIETQVENIAQCPACLSIVNPAAMMCSNCKYILNEDWFKANKDRFFGAGAALTK